MDRLTIDCGEAREMMQSFLDRALPEGQASRLAAHAAACPGCSEALAGARLLAVAFGGWSRVAPPPGFSARVLAAARSARPAPAPLPARVPISVLALAGVATFFWFWDPTRRVIATLLVAGTERSAEESLGLARSVGVVAAVLAPLVHSITAPFVSMFAPAAALGRAVVTAVFHLGAESGILFVGLLAVLAAAALARDRAFARPRRDFHVFSI